MQGTEAPHPPPPPPTPMIPDPECTLGAARDPILLPAHSGTRIFFEPQLFEDKLNEYYRERLALELEFRDKPALVQGYADFCKHLFIPNFTNARVSVWKITPENEILLRTKYDARTEKEVPVLIRYFPLEKIGGYESLPVARYLDIILYSREQCIKEALAMAEKPPEDPAPWRVVSCLDGIQWRLCDSCPRWEGAIHSWHRRKDGTSWRTSAESAGFEASRLCCCWT